MTSSETSDNSFLSKVSDEIAAHGKTSAIQELLNLIKPDQYIGDLLTLDYNSADILIHDSHKIKVGSVPHGCLLIASRVTPEELSLSSDDDYTTLLLLRVSGTTRLNSDIDLDRARFERVQRSNDTNQNYDDPKLTDQFTLNMLRYSGIKCRILGTFSVQKLEADDQWQLHFGADIDNFYAGQGMKIYKPNGEALKKIVNFRNSTSPLSTTRIGCLRYSAATKPGPDAESVPIEISAEDFIAQRTALFGMTRTGKSNTTKTIVSALFGLRQSADETRVGQLIFDPNGEYANDNPQDQGCIRNLKYSDPEFIDDVHTYGSFRHPYDEGRHITKFNFYGEKEPSSPISKPELDQILHTLYRGKQIINNALTEEAAGYIKEFCNAELTTSTDINDRGEYIRFRRRLFIYRSILAEIGFKYTGSPDTKGLFSEKIRNIMLEDDDLGQYVERLGSGTMSWDIAGNFVKAMAEWVKNSRFKKFDRDYASDNEEGRNWSDSHLLGLLEFYKNTRARSIAQSTRQWHDLSSNADYADTIVQQVRDGKLVIVDQLLGDPEMNRQAAERIAHQLFEAQQRSFSQPQLSPETGEIIQPPPVIIYAEEAHTLLPKVGEDDNNIWSRIAKEGAKFNIGVVYSTQEPSSIQTNILKNTENWFIAHLNNTDETNQIRKFKDFSDFVESIINVAEVGLIKVRTRSAYYTIPVQMDLFSASPAPSPNEVKN